MSETRTYRKVSRSLEAMADWLVECGGDVGVDGVNRHQLEAGVVLPGGPDGCVT